MLSLLQLALVLMFGGRDTCWGNFEKWFESKKGKIPDYTLKRYSDYVMRHSGCQYEFDSIPDLIEREKATDTTLDWISWKSANESLYTAEELELLHNEWRSHPRARRFYSKIQEILRSREWEKEREIKNDQYLKFINSLSIQDTFKVALVDQLCMDQGNRNHRGMTFDSTANKWLPLPNRCDSIVNLKNRYFRELRISIVSERRLKKVKSMLTTRSQRNIYYGCANYIGGIFVCRSSGCSYLDFEAMNGNVMLEDGNGYNIGYFAIDSSWADLMKILLMPKSFSQNGEYCQ